MKWLNVHVDDVVLGADQHEYAVRERTLRAGRDWFRLERLDGTGAISCSPPPQDEATLVRRGDHSAEAAAFTAFTGAGFTVGILGEHRE
jgi:hypothetical protein